MSLPAFLDSRRLLPPMMTGEERLRALCFPWLDRSPPPRLTGKAKEKAERAEAGRRRHAAHMQFRSENRPNPAGTKNIRRYLTAAGVPTKGMTADELFTRYGELRL